MKEELVRIVYADDDEEDILLMQKALEKARVANPIDIVRDGEELLEYLRCEGRYEHLKGKKKPGLILLDLNMPRLDGREALEIIKKDANLKRIPVVVLTTSKAEEDILRTYDLGVNSFIKKPISFSSLVEIVINLSNYWFEIVELP
ncbi:response regulator [Spirochaetia bacterium 38H-sp]|uniref:Response regulator n=1 Tax=Rarispira pelagica TaxID=3141764 RepID=A0ABU9UB09_9SPIR